MDTASGVQGVISQFIEDHRHLTKGAGSGNITTKALDQRQTLINQIDSLTSTLRDCLDKLESLSSAAKRLQEEEIRALDIFIGNAKNGRSINNAATKSAAKGTQYISAHSVPAAVSIQTGQSAVSPVSSQQVSKIKPLSDPSWTLVQRRPRTADIIKTERVPGPKSLPTIANNYERIRITDSIVLNAIPVRTFEDVKCDGGLYFVTSCMHFAVIISGMMLHGNIGVIYTDAEEPKKIKDCKFTDGCNRGEMCQYYHDPLIFSRSTDRRNYIASSFVYANPSAMYNKRSRSRHFGSLKHLDTDILGLGDEEKSRMYDQAMHDLLCVLVLKSVEPIKK